LVCNERKDSADFSLLYLQLSGLLLTGYTCLSVLPFQSTLYELSLTEALGGMSRDAGGDEAGAPDQEDNKAEDMS
jgi:hypothetical protein